MGDIECDGVKCPYLAGYDFSCSADGFCQYKNSGPAVPWANAKTCKEVQQKSVKLLNGLYELDVDGDGPISPFMGYCDMVTDGGGWTLVYGSAVGDNEVPLVSNVPIVGNPLSFQHYNLNRAIKMAVAAQATESIFVRSPTVWLKASYPMFDQQLDTPNAHWHQPVTVTAAGGASAVGWLGYSNFNNAGGGDYNISKESGYTCAGGTNQGVDHHQVAYYNLNCGCLQHYLYSYSSGVLDGDAAYHVNDGLGSWTGTSGCATGKEGGSFKFYAGMR